jgi:hypothetical protein
MFYSAICFQKGKSKWNLVLTEFVVFDVVVVSEDGVVSGSFAFRQQRANE